MLSLFLISFLGFAFYFFSSIYFSALLASPNPSSSVQPFLPAFLSIKFSTSSPK
jgi:hypothetical protein